MKTIWQLMDDQPTDQFPFFYNEYLMDQIVGGEERPERGREPKAARPAPRRTERPKVDELPQLWDALTVTEDGLAGEYGYERYLLDVAS